MSKVVYVDTGTTVILKNVKAKTRKKSSTPKDLKTESKEKPKPPKFQLQVQETKTKGRGVFSMSNAVIPKETVVAEYGPLRFVTVEEWNQRVLVREKDSKFLKSLDLNQQTQLPSYWWLEYGIQVNKTDIAIPDVESPFHFQTLGPLINGPNREEKETNNCRSLSLFPYFDSHPWMMIGKFCFSYSSKKLRITIKTTKEIQPKQELLVAYGVGFTHHMKKRT